jgi:hypothetical protein
MWSRALPSLVAASLFASLFSAGCYTVLKHPNSADLVDESNGARRECYDCHAGADAYHFEDPFFVPSYRYYPSSWYDYYARPWWYSDFWYENHPGESPSVDTEGRHLWTRPTPGAPANGDLPPVIGPAPQVSSSGGAPPKTEQTDGAKGKDNEKSQDDRHQWTRGSAKGGRK